MAESTFFKRLRRLLRTNTIIRQISNKRKQLVVKDIDSVQASARRRRGGRYSGIRMNTAGAGVHNFAYGYRPGASFERKLKFFDYEIMDSDPIVSAALDIYADESSTNNEEGKLLKISSDNKNIVEILESLFFDILNLNFNLHPWIRNLVKYGDFFLGLEVTEKYGIINVLPYSVYEIEREEGFDEQNPNSIRFIFQGDRNVTLENYEIVHFRLLSDTNLLPYGKSALENGRKIWKQLQLMEDAMLIYRIMRAPERRVFFVNIGNIPPNEVDNFMEKVMANIKKIPVIDSTTGEYNLRYNVQNIAEDFFFPVRGGEESTRVETLPGGQNTGDIEDIEYLQRKLFAAFKIPKSYLGFDDDGPAKSNLAQEDIRFARTIERIQKIISAELTKIAIIHLYAQGYENKDLVDFTIELSSPSTIYEIQKLELLDKRFETADAAKNSEFFSYDWIFDNILGLTKGDIERIRKGVIFDKKQKFRYDQIENQGNDPAETDKSVDDKGGGKDGEGDEERDLGFTFQDSEEDEEIEDLESVSKELRKSNKPEKPGKRTLGNKPSLGASVESDKSLIIESNNIIDKAADDLINEIDELFIEDEHDNTEE